MSTPPWDVTWASERAASLTNETAALRVQLEVVTANGAHLWRITSSIFVFLMQLGFSLLEAGTVRFKNTRNIMIKNVLDTCVCAIAFWMFGYGIGFGKGNYFFGWKYGNNDENAFFGNAEGSNGIEWFFQFTFAATSTTIIAGAVAERTHLWAYLFYNFFLSSLIYPVIAHIIWSDYGLFSPGRNQQILGTFGVLDNAGSMVVHVTGGVTSLVGSWMVGPRIGRYDIEGNPVPLKGHSMVYTAAGTIILWVGFFGFNGGSVNLIGQDFSTWTNEVARICINTTLSAAFSGLTVFILTHRAKEPTPEDTFNAVIGGLVAACATSSLVQPYAASIIGIGAGLWYLAGVWVLAKLKIDDVVQAAPTHLFCGTWGGLSVGLFATKRGIRHTYSLEPISYGLFYGGGANQLGVQILGLLIVYFWVGITTFILFYVLGFFGVLRVKRHEEEVGLDVAFHGGEEGEEGEGHVGSRNFKDRLYRKKHSGLFGFLRSRRGRKEGNAIADIYARGGYHRRDVWYKSLESTQFGAFSLAMYEANYVMEDTGEVEASSSGVYIGVHDGHGGTDTAEFLKENLYENLKEQFMQQGGGISADSIRAAFAKTEATYTQLVREAFPLAPQITTVGACSATCIITANAIWVANVGNCRAVLGQVRKTESGRECRALQLSVEHSLQDPLVRQKFLEEHGGGGREGEEEGDDLLQEENGQYRIKGKTSVTRSFGDCYLKAHEFNREPLFARFRVPEPFNPPLVSAEPSIVVRLLSPHDAFLIVASDGLFKLISNQEAVDLVASSPKKDVARKLVRAALQRAAERAEVRYLDLLRVASGARRQFHDDITVVVFFPDHTARFRGRRDNAWDPEGSVKGGRSVQDLIGESITGREDVELIGTKHGGLLPFLTPQDSLGEGSDSPISVDSQPRHIRHSSSLGREREREKYQAELDSV